jgi:hypothetical protein
VKHETALRCSVWRKCERASFAPWSGLGLTNPPSLPLVTEREWHQRPPLKLRPRWLLIEHCIRDLRTPFPTLIIFN